MVDVFSPNHLELMQLMVAPSSGNGSFGRETIETHAKHLFASNLHASNAGLKIVIRAGEHGCLLLSREIACRWLPACFDADSAAVVDTTGAGNCFLGAFTNILGATGDLVEAGIYGNVAASFALQQIGMPALRCEDGQELWNSVMFASRLAEYRARLDV
jgi:sugar/nucleoside kinase (ribokinase family)